MLPRPERLRPLTNNRRLNSKGMNLHPWCMVFKLNLLKRSAPSQWPASPRLYPSRSPRKLLLACPSMSNPNHNNNSLSLNNRFNNNSHSKRVNINSSSSNKLRMSNTNNPMCNTFNNRIKNTT